MLPTSRIATTSTKGLLGLASSQIPRVSTATTPARGLSSTPPAQKGGAAPTLLQDQNGFGFARSNPRDPKPRKKGVTEIRGPYYSVMGKRYLADVLETYAPTIELKLTRVVLTPYRMGTHVDGLKFAGG